MKFKSLLLFLITLSFFFYQCSPTLNYIGSTYAPTENVLIFFDENEIQQEHKTMGLLTFNTEPIYNNSDKNKINTLIKNKGKEIGADAVLITKFYSNILQDESKRMVIRETEKLFIEAKFLKFKK